MYPCNPFWQLDVAHWVSAGLKLNELMDCIKLATLVNYKFSLQNFNSVNWIDINIFLDYFDLLYLQLFDIILKLENLNDPSLTIEQFQYFKKMKNLSVIFRYSTFEYWKNRAAYFFFLHHPLKMLWGTRRSIDGKTSDMAFITSK